MSKYDLNQLGADEFEQLAQALLKKIIGSGTITFGAGKDGAREATYQGKSQYPSNNEIWAGDWIFQVKFHDTQRGIKQARSTTKRELRAELEKIVTKYQHPCDNYIFITNVPLSGVYKSGDHDVIKDDIKPDFPSIKNIHVWGADDIHRFLDNYQDIRQAYNLISLEDWNERKKQLTQPKFQLDIPSCPDPEVKRDSLTSHIADSFDTDNQYQILSTPTKTGKTILIAQFKKDYPDQAIVYFIDHTAASQRVHTFLYQIGSQIADILKQPHPDRYATVEPLGTFVDQHLISLKKQAIQQDKKYYILIDGIEHSLTGVKGNRIIDRLPFRTYPKSPYTLLTIDASRFEELSSTQKIRKLDLPLTFNNEQTWAFFDGLAKRKESDSIHNKYGGVPGYIRIIRDAKLNNPNYDLTSSPTDLTQLLTQQVNDTFSSMDSKNKHIIEILAVCNANLSENLLLEFSGQPKTVEVEDLRSCVLVRYINGTYEIANDEIQGIIREQLSTPIRDTQSKLLEFIQEKYPTEDFAIDALIDELADQGRMQKRLQVTPIIETLSDPTTGLSTVLNRFNSAISMAYMSKDLERLLWGSVGITGIRRFPDHLIQPWQIDALIALDEWQQAVDQAYLIHDQVTQINTLSRIFGVLQSRGIKISGEALDGLRYKVESLDSDELDKGLLKQIAISILPIFPDLAIELLETEFGTINEQSIVESVLDAISQPTEISETYDVRGDRDPRTFVLFLGNYAYKEFLENLPIFKNTKAKEYVIRKWCSSNPTNTHLSDALELWQQTIINDRNFVTPLRCLREVSELVKNVPIETRLSVIKQLEVPHIFSLDAPIEEWIQVQMNLAEAIYELDPDACINYLDIAYQKFQEQALDLDQATYFLARLLLTLKKYNLTLSGEIEGKLHTIFYKLRDNSAEQFNAIRRVLPILVEIDQDNAFLIAIELNTFNRRQKAVKLVLIQSLIKLGTQDLSQLIKDTVEETGETDAPRMLTSVLIELAEDKIELSTQNLSSIASFVKQFHSAELETESCKSLGILHSVISSNEAVSWFDRSISAWHRMDDMKKRFAIGYEIVEGLAEIDKNKAMAFYKIVENLKSEPGSNLAVGLLGIDYRQALDLSIRALTKEYLHEQPSIISDITQKIRVIPATPVKAELYAILATALYRLDSVSDADSVVYSELLPLIKKGNHTYEQIATLQKSLPAIFRYDLEDALSILDGIDSLHVDISCHNAIKWRLTNSHLSDHENIPIDKIRISHDRKVLSDCCKLANTINQDYILSITVKLISQCITASLQNDAIGQLQAYDLTNKLEEIVNKKLPQKTKNIQHDGYKIVTLAYINQCRSKLYIYLRNAKGLSPRNFRRDPIKKQWEILIKDARQITNISDRVLVLSDIAVLSYSYYGKGGKHKCTQLLNEAEASINSIPTLIDRASRLENVGDGWRKLEDNGQAKLVYRQVAILAEQLRGMDADERLRSLIQSASAIDDSFAEGLLSNLDTNRLPSGIIQSAKMKHQIEQSIAKPSQYKIKGNKRQREQALQETYESRLSSLIVGRNRYEEPTILVEQLKESLDYSARLTYQVAGWCIENIQRGALRDGLDAQKFIALADVVDQTSRFAVDNNDSIIKMLHDSTPVTNEKIHSFGAGEVEKAKQFISMWISEHTKDNIIFCDPYFKLSELTYLQHVPIECPITIITTERGIDISDGTEQTKNKITNHWKKITDQELPEITVFVYPISSTEKFHDRAIVSDTNAISMGQSLNGLGKSRGIVNLLSGDEAIELETKYITPLLNISKLRRDSRPTKIEI